MGLCKCPKRKVTNQFCFEHQVNVCEYCMIDGSHKICIVGPYMNWLDNSNYESKCNLCQNDLNINQCVRLQCYHILHIDCLDRYANQFPSNTAPAGYTCPCCSKSIFSFTTSRSPITDQLKQLLSSFKWANEGLSILNNNDNNDQLRSSETTKINNCDVNFSSLISDNNSTKITIPTSYDHYDENSSPRILHNSLHTKMNNSTVAPINMNNVTSFISTNSDLSFGSTSSMRSKFDNESRRPLLASVNEIAEDKYRTKSPIEFFSRWLRTRSTFIRNQRTMSSLNLYKKFIIYGFFAFLILFIIIHYFIKYGRQSAENDPFLNPEFDPNIRNHEE